MSEQHDWIVSSLKAAAWERAKGALNEVVALEGSRHTGEVSDRLLHMGARVEAFTRSFEDDGLHE